MSSEQVSANRTRSVSLFCIKTLDNFEVMVKVKQKAEWWIVYVQFRSSTSQSELSESPDTIVDRIDTNRSDELSTMPNGRPGTSDSD